MKINWNNIGAIDGQREGFEELVCQLASKEKIANQKKFIRIGKPDGGKECYWELKDGSLHCWQAKFFLYSFKANEWSQVNKSVKDAINNHSNLRTYYVAVPVDRPDGKGKGKSMLQKWKSKVSEWEDYAAEKGMTVTFEYWGKHELETRLRKKENEGLLYYFFNQEEFSDDWFQYKNQESINALGSRYTPELNFELPIVKIFHGFSRGKDFVQRLNNHFDELLEKFRAVRISGKGKAIKSKYNALTKSITELRSNFESIQFSGITAIPYPLLRQRLTEIYVCIEDLQRSYNSLREHERK
jgi:hypothetical protein